MLCFLYKQRKSFYFISIGTIAASQKFIKVNLFYTLVKTSMKQTGEEVKLGD
jgi:hypothetical protein